MNRDIDERLLPNGQYFNAENIRVFNSESSDVGGVENVLGNRALTSLNLGENVETLGIGVSTFDDRIYWLVRHLSKVIMLLNTIQ